MARRKKFDDVHGWIVLDKPLRSRLLGSETPSEVMALIAEVFGDDLKAAA